MTQLGSNADFEQHSIIGVDFGPDYNEDFGIMPTDLRGKYMNNYDTVEYDSDGTHQNIYNEYDEHLGYSSPDFGALSQMGLLPSGLSAFNGPKPLDNSKYQMGGLMDTLKTPMFTVAGIAVTPMYLALIATVAGAGYWYFKIRK